MRQNLQIAAACAVIAASASAAWAIKLSQADLDSATRAVVTASWTIRGEGKGKTQFEIVNGLAAFYDPDFIAFAALDRFRPDDGVDGAVTALNVTLPFIAATQTVYRAGYNSRRLDMMEAPIRLAQMQSMIAQFVAVEPTEETRSFHPILGNVSVTWASANLTARVYAGFSEYNLGASWKFKSTILDGPNAGKACNGQIGWSVRGADRDFGGGPKAPLTFVGR